MFLLVVMLGGQWVLLQGVAWTGMLIDYSRNASVATAICKTFDGKHPCPLCKAIAAGKKSEQKNSSALTTQRWEYPPMAGDASLIAVVRFPLFAHSNKSAAAAFQRPPVPPPRGQLV